MPIRRRTTLIVVGIAAILSLAFLFVVPALIQVDRYRPQVISYLQEKTGKPGPVFFEAHEISCELQQVDLMAIINPASSSSMDGEGSLKAGLLRFGAVQAKNLDSKLRLGSRQVFFTDIRAEVYGGGGVGGLSFDLSEKNVSFKTDARLSGINLAQLLAAFPNGGGKMTGKMEGNVRLGGGIAHSH